MERFSLFLARISHFERAISRDLKLLLEHSVMDQKTNPFRRATWSHQDGALRQHCSQNGRELPPVLYGRVEELPRPTAGL